MTEDLKDRRFERLIVLERAENKSSRVHWLCRCNCGKHRIVSAQNLKRGFTRSCGCLKSELVKRRATKHGYSKIKVSSEYGTWEWIRRSGEVVQPEWNDSKGFTSFFEHIGPKPDPDMRIKRINLSKGFVAGNVRWVYTEPSRRHNVQPKPFFDTHELNYLMGRV